MAVGRPAENASPVRDPGNRGAPYFTPRQLLPSLPRRHVGVDGGDGRFKPSGLALPYFRARGYPAGAAPSRHHSGLIPLL